MKKRWLAAILLFILVPIGASIFMLIQKPELERSASPSPTPITVPSASPMIAPKIGTFYYVWYGALSDDWKPTKFVDYPVFGNYSSSNPTIIKQQLISMKNLGIDFVVISWWGNRENDSYGQFIDNNTRLVFQVAKDNNIDLKLALMVEPYLGNGNPSGSSHNYTEIYNYINDNFITPFPSLYCNYDSKPLACFFNDPDNIPGSTPNGTVPPDNRFTTILVGQQNYTQWTYLDLNIYDMPTNVPHAKQISVAPRYDDSRLNRTETHPVDPNLTQGTYEAEWRNAIKNWKEGKIDSIMVTSWNEYPERTAIEPHYDNTSLNRDPYLLYDQTKIYINEIHQLAEANLP